MNSNNSIKRSEIHWEQSTYKPLFLLARLLDSGNKPYYELEMTRLDEDKSKDSKGIIKES